MNNKGLCMVLALLMMLMSSVAFAATNSATTKTTTYIEPVEETVATPVVIQTVAETAAVKAVKDEIATLLSTPGAAVITFFNESVQSQIVQLLPVGVDATKLVMNEFVPIAAFGDATADAVVAFEFATPYKDGEIIVAMLGIIGANGETTWLPLKANVSGGKVNIYFTQDAIALMASGDCVLAILSEE